MEVGNLIFIGFSTFRCLTFVFWTAGKGRPAALLLFSFRLVPLCSWTVFGRVGAGESSVWPIGRLGSFEAERRDASCRASVSLRVSGLSSVC